MMNKIKNLSKKTKVILLAVCLIAIAGIGSVITACTNAKPDNGADDNNKTVATESATEPTEQATEESTELPTEEKTEEPTKQATENPTEEVTEQPTEKPTEKKDTENKKEEATIVQTTTITTNNQTNNNSNNSSNSNTNTGTATQSKPVNNNTTTNNNTGNSTPSKVWHEAEYKTVHHPAETKKIWVVDQEGYTYEESVYERHGRTICNHCGADITDNCSEHIRNHMIDGIPASYRSETREIQVGTKTITVEEKGHWETQVVKEAWDEQVLIKEAGYY